MWKVIKSEYISNRPWLTVRKEHVRLNNGNEIDEYYVIEYPNFVNVIAQTTDSKFVLIRQYRHAVSLTSLELPAGVVDKGESPLDAAKRELLEETGFGNGEWEFFMKTAPNPSSMTNFNYTFIARGVEKIREQNLEQTEELEVVTCSEDKLYHYLNQGQIIQALMLAPLWKFFQTRIE